MPDVMPLISVIMPTYGRSGFLKRAVASVLRQTYAPLELIVVDDNGEGTPAREQTTAALSEFAEDPRVRRIDNPVNLGGALARNAGIRAARGAYVAFLDDDDEYLPDRLRRQEEWMAARELDACVMDGATYDLQGRLVGEKRQRFPENPTRDNLLVAHMLYHLTGTNTLMFRTEALTAAGGFDDVPAGHEFFLMLKVIEKGLKVGYLPEILVRNCTHDGGRISMGDGKIRAQRLILEAKRRHFDLLTSSQKRLVLCRHYGGIFYVHYVKKRYLRAAWYLMRAVMCSPGDALELFAQKRGRLRRRGEGA